MDTNKKGAGRTQTSTRTVCAPVPLNLERSLDSMTLAAALTSIHEMGQATGPSTIMRVYTSHDMPAAMASWFFPVKTAEGKISPKKRTSDTDRITASHEGTRFPKKMGRAWEIVRETHR